MLGILHSNMIKLEITIATKSKAEESDITPILRTTIIT
jgi:hypothetical protein